MAGTPKSRILIVASGEIGLYYGEVSESDEQIAKTKMAHVAHCRHIAYWEGPEGGITSLAEIGPTAASKIGVATSTPSTILDVRNLFPVSAAAAAKFEAVAVKP